MRVTSGFRRSVARSNCYHRAIVFHVGIVLFHRTWPSMTTLSDRFYLNSVGCYSETENPNYVLHRGHYMQKILEEDVKCIILSTYGLNIDSALSELHGLLNEKSKVPTLIIHGDKGKALNVASNARRRLRLKKSCIKSEDQTNDADKLVAEAKIKSEDNDHTRRSSNAMRSFYDSELSPNRPSEVSGRRDFSEYSNHVCIERVAPQWLYPHDRSNLNSPVNANSRNSTSDVHLETSNPIKSEIRSSPHKILKRPKSNDRFGGHVAGVHHPKFILAFTSKGVHVLIR